MPGNLDGVGQNTVAAEIDVVGDVHTDEESVVVADPRDRPAHLSARMGGDVLAEDVVVADNQFGPAAMVLDVLRRRAQHDAWEQLVVAPEARCAHHRHVVVQPTGIADDNVRPDVTMWTDFDISPQLGFVVDAGTGMD